MTDLTAEDADDPSKPICLLCQINACDDCLHLTRPTSCDHVCAWLLRIEDE